MAQEELEDNFEGGFEGGVNSENTTEAIGFIPLEGLEPAKRTAALIVISGRAFGKSYNLTSEECVIGRAPECQVRLDDDGISRRHAKIIQTEGHWLAMDLNSTNGTFHGGERVQVLTLYDGAKVQLGMGTVLRFQYQDHMDERYQRSMYESKTRDALTEAYNRAYFMEAIDREVAYAIRHGQRLCLLMFDIDHFKKVNDTYGHPAGDLALKQICRCVQNIIRREDILCRYGGEEFGLLLRNTAPEMAFILAERIRRAVERLEITHEGRRIPTTISIGISHTGDSTKTPNELIESADERLFQAKGRGRNRTEAPLFDQDPSQTSV